MGKARRIEFGHLVFERAGDATQHFSAMLNRYGIGQQVNADDHNDLLALIERHDERDEKVGRGIAAFEVNRAPDPEHPNNCFWIVRTDGSRIDFSFPHCLKKKPYD